MATVGSADIFEPVTHRAAAEDLGWLSEHWTGEAVVFRDPKPSTAKVAQDFSRYGCGAFAQTSSLTLN